MSKRQKVKCFLGAHDYVHWTIDEERVALRACIYCSRIWTFSAKSGWIIASKSIKGVDVDICKYCGCTRAKYIGGLEFHSPTCPLLPF